MMDSISNLISVCNDDLPFDLLSGRNVTLFAQKIVSSASIIALFDEGQLAAFVSYYANSTQDEFAFINMLCVGAAHRRGGLARTLVAAAISAASRKGFSEIRLEVSKNNTAAYIFYEKLLFEIVEVRETSFLLARSCMAK